ncbi:MAG: site-2 protease family protein [Anaerolineales bacterium]|nr:site-2 protease family protein [Anaerolineales bacterium]
MEPAVEKVFTCSRCKKQSPVEIVFTKEQRFFGLLTRLYCPDCALRRTTTSAVVGYILLPLAGLALYLLLPGRQAGQTALLITFSLFLFLPLVVVHELAHALTAALLGFRVFGILLGGGRRVFYGKILGLKWDVRAIPLGGATILAGPPAPAYRLKNFLIYLAGPAAHALLALLCGVVWLMTLWLPVPRFWSTLMLLSGFMNGFLFLANLWPRKFPVLFGANGSDGWHLMRIFFWKPDELAQRQASYYALAAMEASEERRFEQARRWTAAGLLRYPDDEMLLNVSGVVDTRIGEYERARQAFVRLLPGSEHNPAFKNLILNNVAYVDVMLEDPALLPEADRYSAEAYQNVPWEPAIQGTRGLVLVTLGRPDEGLPLLQSAFKKNPDRQGRAIEACFIALAEARRGNPAEAHKYQAAARALDPECIVLKKVAGELLALPHA